MNFRGTRLLMGEDQGRFDGHCHVFKAGLPMIPKRRYTPDYDALPENLCKLLQTHELDGALLIQPSFFGTDNHYLLNTLAELNGEQTHQVFRGVVVLDPAAPPSKEDITQLSAQGIIGVRLNLYKSTEPFDYETWRPLLERVEKQGWHIELHCEANRLQQVLPHLVRHHANVVIDHFGLVTSLDKCCGLETILQQPPEHLWIKLSASYRLGQQLLDNEDQSNGAKIESLSRVFAEFVGEDRLVWGSDWPFTQFENQINYADVVPV